MKILQIAHHRNGVFGAPFHAVLFLEDNQQFLATVFEAPNHVSVICTDLLESDGVAFGANSWRGDRYEDKLRTAIAQWENDRNASLMARSA